MQKLPKIWLISYSRSLFTFFFSLSLFGLIALLGATDVHAQRIYSPASVSGMVITYGSDFDKREDGTTNMTAPYVSGPVSPPDDANCLINYPYSSNPCNYSGADEWGYPVGSRTHDYTGIPNGNYRVYVYDRYTDGGVFISHIQGYFDMTISGGSVVVTPPPPTDTSTRIITISPENASTTDYSPTISGTFYNDTPLYDQLLLNLSWVEPSVNSDLLLSGLAHRQFIFDIGTSTSDQSFSTTTADLLTGRWLMTAQFSNGLSGSDYFTSTTTSFVVGTTTTLFSQFFETYTASTSTTTAGSVISDCSSASNIVEKAICSLGDRIKDVLQYLFIPDSSVSAKFSALKEEIFRRVPFGYFPLVKATLQDVSASSTPIYNFVMPLARQPLFNSLRSTLSAVLYLWWIIHMWHRFKSIQL